MMLRVLGLVLPLTLLAACASLQVQSPLTPGAAFKGPSLTESSFTSFDGAQLPVSEWKAKGEPWAVIIGVHGFDDYANAFHLAAPVWAQDGVTTIAYDQRGFGRAPHRGIWPGTDLLVRDIKTIVPLVKAQYPHAIIAVAGVSMGGGASIVAFSGDDPPPADRLVLLSPAVWGWSSQPLAYKTALFTVGHLTPGLTLGAPHIGAKVIHTSDNRQELIAMGRDPNMMFDARTDVLYGMVDLMQAAWEDAGKVKGPALYLYGAHDEVIPKNAAFHAAAALPAGDKTVYYKEGYHLLLVDKQRDRVIHDVEGFLRDPNAPSASGAGAIPKKEG